MFDLFASLWGEASAFDNETGVCLDCVFIESLPDFIENVLVAPQVINDAPQWECLALRH